MRILIIVGLVVVAGKLSAAQCTRLGKCCPVRDDSCAPKPSGRKCYCDQFCVENKDCCSDYNSTCGRNGPDSWDDSQCTSVGGQCKFSSIECGRGFFLKGKCAGPSERQCCLSNTNHGDITRVKASGASNKTSRQEPDLDYYGVNASEYMANQDLIRMNKYKRKIVKVGRKLRVDPAIIAAIISRGSRAGNILTKAGKQRGGEAFGLMQIDPGTSGLHVKGGPFSRAHIMQGTRYLLRMIHQVSLKFPTWTDEMKLKGGISAYKAGPENVRSYHNMDSRTTGHDYANDVVARAKWYKRNGYN